MLLNNSKNLETVRRMKTMSATTDHVDSYLRLMSVLLGISIGILLR
jgi:hypothetical protein